MYKSIKILWITALFLLFQQANGQYLGIKGGLNLSTQIAEDNTGSLSDNYDRLVGFHAGVLAGIGFGPVAVEGNILFSSKGYTSESSQPNGETYREYMNPLYFDVPIDLKLRLGLGNAKLYASAGPVFGFGFAGKLHHETILNDETIESMDEKIKWGSSTEDDLKPFDVGLSVGAGIDIGNLMLGFRYNFGLSNLSPVTTNGEVIKNNVMQFSLGFRLFDL